MVVLKGQQEGKKPASIGEEFTNVEDIGWTKKVVWVLPKGVPRPMRNRALGHGKSKEK